MIEDITIISIETTGKIIPNGGSWTGYCQYLKLEVTFSDNTRKEIVISNWYTDKYTQWKEFEDHMKTMLSSGRYVVISDETYNMFFNAIYKI